MIINTSSYSITCKSCRIDAYYLKLSVNIDYDILFGSFSCVKIPIHGLFIFSTGLTYPGLSSSVNPISFGRFLILIHYNLILISYFDSFVFHLSCCIFPIFKAHWLHFSFLILSLSTRMFFFFNRLISFIFVPNLRYTWQGISNVFRPTPLVIAFLNEFYDPFVLVDKSFVRAKFPFN